MYVFPWQAGRQDGGGGGGAACGRALAEEGAGRGEAGRRQQPVCGGDYGQGSPLGKGALVITTGWAGRRKEEDRMAKNDSLRGGGGVREESVDHPVADRPGPHNLGPAVSTNEGTEGREGANYAVDDIRR